MAAMRPISGGQTSAFLQLQSSWKGRLLRTGTAMEIAVLAGVRLWHLADIGDPTRRRRLKGPKRTFLGGASVGGF